MSSEVTWAIGRMRALAPWGSVLCWVPGGRVYVEQVSGGLVSVSDAVWVLAGEDRSPRGVVEAVGLRVHGSLFAYKLRML